MKKSVSAELFLALIASYLLKVGHKVSVSDQPPHIAQDGTLLGYSTDMLGYLSE
jgi:hypothetical protein